MKTNTILHVTGMQSAKYGSLERYFLELSKFCNETGYQTILQYEGRPASEQYAKDLGDHNVELIIAPIFQSSGNPFKNMVKIARLIRSVKPEIINTHFIYNFDLLLVPVIARMLGVKKVIHVQHSVANYREASTIRLLASKFAYNRYDRILGVSSAVADDVQCTGVCSKKVSAHYLGLFGKRTRSEELRIQFRKEFDVHEEGVVLGCIAFDTPFKGLDILLDALSEVVKDYSDTHVILIGVDPDRSSLPTRAANLGLSEHVHWAGIRDDGWKMLNAADIYIQPSRFGEGLSLAIMEAMALKMPVIATRTAGNSEAVIDGRTGYLCEPGIIDSLVDALKRSFLDQTNWNAMGQAGYKLYQHKFQGSESVKALAENIYALKVRDKSPVF